MSFTEETPNSGNASLERPTVAREFKRGTPYGLLLTLTRPVAEIVPAQTSNFSVETPTAGSWVEE